MHLAKEQDKTVNRSRLGKQIVRCNTIINSGKFSYYKNIVREPSHDSKRLWRVLRKALDSVTETILLPHASENNLEINLPLTSAKTN